MSALGSVFDFHSTMMTSPQSAKIPCRCHVLGDADYVTNQRGDRVHDSSSEILRFPILVCLAAGFSTEFLKNGQFGPDHRLSDMYLL